MPDSGTERRNYGNFWHRKRGGHHLITYLVGLVGKASSMNDKWIPILCGVCGGLLGAVSYYLAPIPDFPAGDPITAIAVGIVSGLAATGINQAVKQLSKGE